MDDTRSAAVAVCGRWHRSVTQAKRTWFERRGFVPRRRVIALAEQLRSQLDAEADASAAHRASADWICWRLRQAPQAILAHRLSALSRGHWGGFEASAEFEHFLSERLAARRGHLLPSGLAPAPGPVNLMTVARTPNGRRGRPNTAYIHSKPWQILARNHAASELFEIHRAWGQLQRRGPANAWQAGMGSQANPMPNSLDEGLARRIEALTAEVASTGRGGPQAVVRLGPHPPMRLHLEVHIDRIAEKAHATRKLLAPWWQCPMAACSVFIACTEAHLQPLPLRRSNADEDHPSLVRLKALRWCLSPIPVGARRHREFFIP